MINIDLFCHRLVYKKIKEKPLLDTTIRYDVFSYIVPYISSDDKENTIIYAKILPLNKIINKHFLYNNYLKICYDISKALLIFKKINYIHNDCVLDNIGIYRGNFILYDFDGCGTPEEKNKDFEYDYKSLERSFDFCGFKLSFKYDGIFSVIQHLSKEKDISFCESFEFLENLKII